MHPLAGPLAVAAVLLMAAGAPKSVRPETTVGALRSVGVRVPALLVRVGAIGEIVLGAAAIVAGGTLACSLVAVSYAGFTAFVVVALRSGGAVSSCGCVGREDTPPTAAHLAVTATLATVAAAAALTGMPGLPTQVSASPVAGVLTLAIVAIACWLAWLGLTALPALSALLQPVAAERSR